MAFVQTWLDEYSEDVRDPPLHPALRLLLDHLRISSAVHDSMRSQPNFCSLAGQAEELLRTFQKEGDPSLRSMTQQLWPRTTSCFITLLRGLIALLWLLLMLALSEVASSGSSASADLEQDDLGSGDEDSGSENSQDQGGIMDFSAAAIAEQLTQVDSVC